MTGQRRVIPWVLMELPYHDFRRMEDARSPKIRAFFAYWQSLHRDGRPGERASFDPTEVPKLLSSLLLGDIQAAWSDEDVSRLERLATPEMVSYFARDLADNKARNAVNKVTGVKLLQGDLAESWREANIAWQVSRPVLGVDGRRTKISVRAGPTQRASGAPFATASVADSYFADALPAVAGVASIILSSSSLSMTCDHMG